MKKLLVLAIVALMATSVFGQASKAYSKGQITAGGGIGLISSLGGTPIWLNAEYGWNEEMGISAGFGMQTYSVGSWDVSWKTVSVGGTWHKDYLNMDNVDTYANVRLGFVFASSEWKGASNAFKGVEPTVGSIFYDASVGIAYYVIPNLSVVAEVGYGLALLKIGAAYKL